MTADEARAEERGAAVRFLTAWAGDFRAAMARHAPGSLEARDLRISAEQTEHAAKALELGRHVQRRRP